MAKNKYPPPAATRSFGVSTLCIYAMEYRWMKQS